MDSLPAEPQGKSKNTGVGSLSLLQGIFWTQELTWGILHCRQILYQLSYQGISPKLLNITPFPRHVLWALSFVSHCFIFNTDPTAHSCKSYLFIDDYSLDKIFSFVSACVCVCVCSVVSDLGGRLRTSKKSYYLRQWGNQNKKWKQSILKYWKTEEPERKPIRESNLKDTRGRHWVQGQRLASRL